MRLSTRLLFSLTIVVSVELLLTFSMWRLQQIDERKNASLLQLNIREVSSARSTEHYLYLVHNNVLLANHWRNLDDSNELAIQRLELSQHLDFLERYANDWLAAVEADTQLADVGRVDKEQREYQQTKQLFWHIKEVVRTGFDWHYQLLNPDFNATQALNSWNDMIAQLRPELNEIASRAESELREQSDDWALQHKQQWSQIWLTFIGASLFALLVLWLVVRRFTRSIAALQQYTEHVLDPSPPVMATDVLHVQELLSLADTMQTVANTARQRRVDLANSLVHRTELQHQAERNQQQLRLLLDALPDALVQFDQNVQLLNANPAFYQLLQHIDFSVP